jgi:hypothetical protein
VLLGECAVTVVSSCYEAPLLMGIAAASVMGIAIVA